MHSEAIPDELDEEIPRPPKAQQDEPLSSEAEGEASPRSKAPVRRRAQVLPLGEPRPHSARLARLWSALPSLPDIVPLTSSMELVLTRKCCL